MKKAKKFLAGLLAATMLAAMGAAPAMAAAQMDMATILTVKGVEEGATVKLYQIWKGKYNDSKDSFIGWDKKENLDFADSAAPKQAEIADFAAKVQSETAKYTHATEDMTPGAVSDKKADYTYNVTDGAGVWIAIVTPAQGSKTVYNPILLAAGYKVTGGAVNLEEPSVAVTDKYLEAPPVVAKSTTPGVEKEASATPDADKITASVGQPVVYKVTPTMPQYPKGAINRTFFFSDTMSEGLTFDYASLTVKWNNNMIKANENGEFQQGGKTIAKAVKNGNGFHLAFIYDELNYIAPTLEYKAILNEKAVVGLDGNTNEVKMFYTNNPAQGPNHDDPNTPPDPQTDKTIVEEKKEKKVYTYQISFKKTGVDTDAQKLPGAVFGIYEDQQCTKLIDTVTTNAEGYAVSNQVGKGTYYIKEITAPAGYTLNTKVYQAEAQWASVTTTTTSQHATTEYTSNIDEATVKTQVGWLKDNVFYRLDAKPDGTDVQVLKAYVKSTTTNTETETTIQTNQAAGSGTVSTFVELGQNQDLTAIPNTKTPTLPSTGGMGTYLFTAIGVALMALAAGLSLAKRRKVQQ